MLKNFLYQRITEHFSYSPTHDQDKLLHLLCQFTETKDRNSLLIIKGYAGTGKTSVISAYVNALKSLRQQFVLMAPTGRAAKVLSHYAGHPAFTIHKHIYRQDTNKTDDARFKLGFNSHRDQIFIVDEASMISNDYSPGSMFGSGRLLDDLLQFVYNQDNCRLIMIGDTAQLPPVSTIGSPALEISEFESRGFSVLHTELTQVIRQAESSGILMNATGLRNQLQNDPKSLPKFTTADFDDIHRISGTELVDLIESEYQNAGMEEVKVICRSNKNANVYNQGIRNQILGREEELSPGDILMVVKNNYFWLPENSPINFIANGDMIEIVRLKGIHEMYGFRFQDALVKFVDYPELEVELRLMLDILMLDGPSLPSDRGKQFYGDISQDYAHLGNKKKQFDAMRKDPFLNALQVKYAYALTCHKAQGGQWKVIFIDQGYITEEMMGASYYRWIYTAMTRATKTCYIVNFPDAYFVEG